MSDELKIRVRPMCKADEERAARLERHANWLYKKNAEFRAAVDAMPTHAEVLMAIALYGSYPPPDDAETALDFWRAPKPESPQD